jgi:hypothetical protein
MCDPPNQIIKHFCCCSSISPWATFKERLVRERYQEILNLRMGGYVKWGYYTTSIVQTVGSRIETWVPTRVRESYLDHYGKKIRSEKEWDFILESAGNFFEFIFLDDLLLQILQKNA